MDKKREKLKKKKKKRKKKANSSLATKSKHSPLKRTSECFFNLTHSAVLLLLLVF